MGIFDKIGGQSNFPSNEEEASIGVLIAVMSIDGRVSDDEIAFFNLIANRNPVLRDMSNDSFHKSIDRVLGLLNREDWESVIKKCAPCISEKMKQTVFSLCVDLVLADGEVHNVEKSAIEMLQNQLSIDEMLARKIVDVLAIKNGLVD